MQSSIARSAPRRSTVSTTRSCERYRASTPASPAASRLSSVKSQNAIEGVAIICSDVVQSHLLAGGCIGSPPIAKRLRFTNCSIQHNPRVKAVTDRLRVHIASRPTNPSEAGLGFRYPDAASKVDAEHLEHQRQ